MHRYRNEADMREIISFNDNWIFSRDGRNREPVTLPHTWNAADGMNGSEYCRGVCRYQKDFPTPSLRDGMRVFLEILACSLSGTVLVNGEELACHEGGYSSFTVDITKALRPAGAINTITILADNAPKNHIYPQMADFTFYGGLYRGVNLLILPGTHFDVSFHGSSGLTVAPELTETGAILHLNSRVTRPSPDYTVRYTVIDADGKDIAESWRPAENPETAIFLAAPHLWQGVYDPYLYRCTAALVYRNETVDLISTPFGIRSFFVDPEKGFFLNGIPMMLRGVARHQDRLGQGNALTREQHYEDAALIAEMGANTVRLAHYQHSRDFYDACDEYGFIVWAEIPYISCQSDDPDAHENCRLQLKELIYQNYNHPSICFWGISNEITMGGKKPGLAENHRNLHMLVKELDPGRLTAMAHASTLPIDSELHGITDLEGYNHYFGWYGGSFEKNEAWLDEFHEKHSEICLGLSEYGAEGVVTWQTDCPKCRDYSERYQAEYHEHMAKILSERPFVWCAYIWNMFDFASAVRNEGGVAGRNNKGLVTIDRSIRKEAFYLYKAYWSREPFVYLCGRRYAQRAAGSITVKVYSNCPSVTLHVNGRVFDTRYGDKIFFFENVPLSEGFTFLTATAPAVNIGMPAFGTAPKTRLYALPPQTVSDSITLEQIAEKPEIYTLPQDDEAAGDRAVNWFDTVETVASDAPMEFSKECYSVHDKIKTLCSSEKAFSILSGALCSMTGMKIGKSELSMLGERTLLELTDMAEDLGGSLAADETKALRKVPANALQIINAELGKVKKPDT